VPDAGAFSLAATPPADDRGIDGINHAKTKNRAGGSLFSEKQDLPRRSFAQPARRRNRGNTQRRPLTAPMANMNPSPISPSPISPLRNSGKGG